VSGKRARGRDPGTSPWGGASRHFAVARRPESRGLLWPPAAGSRLGDQIPCNSGGEQGFPLVQWLRCSVFSPSQYSDEWKNTRKVAGSKLPCYSFSDERPAWEGFLLPETPQRDALKPGTYGAEELVADGVTGTWCGLSHRAEARRVENKRRASSSGADSSSESR